MTKYSLAIPAVSFLLVSVFLPALAQAPSETPAAPSPPAATAQGQAEKLPDEERARLYLARKEYREAQELFYRLTLEQPKNPVYWNELGISLHHQMELRAALKCYERAFKLDPSYADALNNAGTIYYEQKKFSRAIRAYDKAIALRGGYAPFYVNLGYAYFGTKDYEDSIGAFRKALEIDPTAFEASRSRSGTVIEDRSLSVDRAHFYFLLAKSFAESGNVERCLIYLRKASDEGYPRMNDVKTDPAFAAMLKVPEVQELLLPKTPEKSQP